MFDLESALRRVIEIDGSDLHLKVPSRPLIRHLGQLEPIPDTEELKPQDTEGALRELLKEPGKLEEFADVADEERGIILVTGTTGSGKSSSLAAMIDQINRFHSKHIVTIEDPIEFLHRDKRSIINQREVGADTASFKRALRRVLRQDPDVILVGEMRDEETVSTALSAAETGHLVFSTLHTADAAETVNRILEFYDANEQAQARS